tara:strand:+ start:10086 stop:11393 length:1308 start_codon:yes stop_codon:yes gene_type:complete
MKDLKIKKWLFGLFSVVFLYPMVELVTPIKISVLLHKSNLTTSIVDFTGESWFSGSYQESFSDYVNDNIGFYPLFVKIHNQIEYDLFGNIYTGNVLAGKEDFLFEKAYVEAYFGREFKGLKTIRKNVSQLKELQDTLANRGKYFMVCLAAGKCTYYPEYIPEEAEKDSTNYEYYVKEFKKEGINHIDVNPWFLQMKDSLGYLLYPQYGIHWSHYGAILVTDSIAKKFSKENSWDLPEMHIVERTYSDVAKYYDNDIANSMNLFKEVQPQPMIYPKFEWRGEKSKKPLKLLIVGDSFTWDLFEYSRIGSECFDEVEFWFYNQTVHRDAASEGGNSNGLPTLTRHLDIAKKIDDFDAFLLLSNEPNLANFGWNFTNDLLGVLADSTFVPRERNNEYLKQQAMVKKPWREDLEKQAEARGVSLDSMIKIYLHDPNYKP